MMASTKDAEHEATRQIHTLIKGVQARKFRSQQKKYLNNFMSYYVKEKPEITRGNAEYLLYGSGELKGLLETCGNTNVKTIMSLKRSSLIAMDVLHTLLTTEPKTNMHRFQSLLAKPDKVSVFLSMRLHRHIRQFAKFKAFNVISLILEKNPRLTVYDILGKTQGARDSAAIYLKWDMVRKEREREKKRMEKRRNPKRWSDVKEEELNLDGSDDEGGAMAQDFDESDDEDDDVKDPLALLTPQDVRVILASRAGIKKTYQSEHGSINTCKPDFSPELFLSTMHSDQSFEELQHGVNNLKENVSSRLHNMRELVKQHFDQFVSCKTIIDAIHDHLKKEVMNRGMGLSRTARLDNKLQTLQRTADTLYKPLVARKKKTDRIRGALDVLKRFRFFFSLPGALKRHIKHNEYSDVVRLYERSKSYKLASDAPILHAVTRAVGGIVQRFRESLLKKLQNPHSTLEEHQNVIGFLENLDCEVDPAWYYLTRRADWMVSKLEKWQRQFLKQSVRSASSRGRHGRSFRGNKGALTSPRSLDGQNDFDTEVKDDSHEQHDPEMVTRLVGRMARFLTQHLPDFYKLSTRIPGGVKPVLQTPKPSRLARFPGRAADEKAAGGGDLNLNGIGGNPREAPGFARAADVGAILGEHNNSSSETNNNINGGGGGIGLTSSSNPILIIDSPATGAGMAMQSPRGDDDDGGGGGVFRQHSIHHQQQQEAAALSPRFGTRVQKNGLKINISDEANAGVLNNPGPISNQLDREADEDLRHNDIAKALTVKQLFDCIGGTYTKIVRRNIFPEGTPYRNPAPGRSKSLANEELEEAAEIVKKQLAYLHRNVVAITHEFESVDRLTSAPSSLMDGLRSLADDSIQFYVGRVCMCAMTEIAGLASEETWQSDPATPSITSLPGRFQAIVADSLEMVATAMPSRKPQWMVELLVAPFLEFQRIFADVLHALAFKGHGSGGANHSVHRESMKETGRSMRRKNSAISRSIAEDNGMRRNEQTEEEARKILVVLANAMHTQRRVLPALWDKLSAHLPTQYRNIVEPECLRITNLYKTLARMVMDKYTRVTTLQLTTFITRGLTTSGRDWSKPNPVVKVREYVLELLLELVLVYDDLLAIVKPYVVKVIKSLLVMLCDSFYSLARTVGVFSSSGALQVFVEVEFVKRVMKGFLTPPSAETLRDLKLYLEQFISKDPRVDRSMRSAEKLVQDTCRTTRVMFACFESPAKHGQLQVPTAMRTSAML